jgi:hypothetical protein
VGWASTTQATSYSLMKSRALNSNVPYVLAGRDSRDAEPHPIWKLLDEVPDSVVGYWQRVNYIAVASKGRLYHAPVQMLSAALTSRAHSFPHPSQMRIP